MGLKLYRKLPDLQDGYFSLLNIDFCHKNALKNCSEQLSIIDSEFKTPLGIHSLKL
jgi:hypothetical protein